MWVLGYVLKYLRCLDHGMWSINSLWRVIRKEWRKEGDLKMNQNHWTISGPTTCSSHRERIRLVTYDQGDGNHHFSPVSYCGV